MFGGNIRQGNSMETRMCSKRQKDTPPHAGPVAIFIIITSMDYGWPCISDDVGYYYVQTSWKF
jgi:hypothetical protein